LKLWYAIGSSLAFDYAKTNFWFICLTHIHKSMTLHLSNELKSLPEFIFTGNRLNWIFINLLKKTYARKNVTKTDSFEYWRLFFIWIKFSSNFNFPLLWTLACNFFHEVKYYICEHIKTFDHTLKIYFFLLVFVCGSYFLLYALGQLIKTQLKYLFLQRTCFYFNRFCDVLRQKQWVEWVPPVR
jgi:hypothetical protein